MRVGLSLSLLFQLIQTPSSGDDQRSERDQLAKVIQRRRLRSIRSRSSSASLQQAARGRKLPAFRDPVGDMVPVDGVAGDD